MRAENTLSEDEEREAVCFHYLLSAEHCEKMKLLMRAKYIECSCLVNELTLYTGVGSVFVNQRRKKSQPELKIVRGKLLTSLMTHTHTHSRGNSHEEVIIIVIHTSRAG